MNEPGTASHGSSALALHWSRTMFDSMRCQGLELNLQCSGEAALSGLWAAAKRNMCHVSGGGGEENKVSSRASCFSGRLVAVAYITKKREKIK